MRWLLQDAVLDERLDEALDIVHARGDDAVVISGRRPDILDIPDSDALTIGMVSVRIAREIYSKSRFRPGVFWHPTAYSVTSYAPWFGHLMLNDDMVWVPFGEFARRGADAWRRVFGGAAVFIKPDGGGKVFTGQEIPFDGFGDAIHALDATSGVTPETLIGVCRSKRIDGDLEWRFWLGEAGVVASSPYSWKDVPPAPPPPDVVAVVEEMADWCADERNRAPDRVFVADLCLTDGRARLVEINAASTSGVYQADIGAILEALNSAAMRELSMT